jgi:hypothetical protein
MTGTVRAGRKIARRACDLCRSRRIQVRFFPARPVRLELRPASQLSSYGQANNHTSASSRMNHRSHVIVAPRQARRVRF